MPVIDLRIYKRELRDGIKARRRALPPEAKAEADRAIARRLLDTWQYRECETLMIYASTAIEVDTYRVIERALADGKRVALPRCIPGTRNMNFHYVGSLDELSPGTFSVNEPSADAPLVSRPERALMVVPALSLDWSGYRLGYGGGYYDRYIAEFKGRTIGICYSSDCRRRLRHGRFDRTVDVIITEEYIRRTTPKMQGENKNERL